MTMTFIALSVVNSRIQHWSVFAGRRGARQSPCGGAGAFKSGGCDPRVDATATRMVENRKKSEYRYPCVSRQYYPGAAVLSGLLTDLLAALSFILRLCIHASTHA